MSTLAPALDGALVEQLRVAVHGDLIQPGEPGYDEARRVYNAMHDRRPAAVVRAADAGDVIATVNFAREQGLLLAVRGGSHSVSGYGTCDDGVVLDLAGMRGIRVDPAARTARAEGGCTWADFNHATHAFGLAATGGVVSSTGLGGLTTGGGMGHLARRCGLACDNLVSADVVTADGAFVTCSEEHNTDLFWALRGGGGNFGVVTSFAFRDADFSTALSPTRTTRAECEANIDWVRRFEAALRPHSMEGGVRQLHGPGRPGPGPDQLPAEL
ncbi:FAD binding domain-containing protein [Kitasatospora atroaurantiaca]|uniref:FAD binding domain-containing protein n=1 Tax=Kitasatospora atroaurantiaca TaxID=285545 RepID=A0A561EUJ0_9ACTN|nr:FAD binding domain-containing protein [Kitasatospora atroaurantiaca]